MQYTCLLVIVAVAMCAFAAADVFFWLYRSLFLVVLCYEYSVSVYGQIKSFCSLKNNTLRLNLEGSHVVLKALGNAALRFGNIAHVDKYSFALALKLLHKSHDKICFLLFKGLAFDVKIIVADTVGYVGQSAFIWIHAELLIVMAKSIFSKKNMNFNFNSVKNNQESKMTFDALTLKEGSGGTRGGT